MIALLTELVTLLIVAPTASAQTAVPPGEAIYEPGRDITPPRVTKPVYVSYSPDAFRRKLRGVIRLRCVVTRDGTTTDVKLVNGLESDLDANAVAALKQWKFEPGKRDGEPVAVRITVDMTFTLRRRGRNRALSRSIGDEPTAPRFARDARGRCEMRPGHVILHLERVPCEAERFGEGVSGRVGDESNRRGIRCLDGDAGVVRHRGAHLRPSFDRPTTLTAEHAGPSRRPRIRRVVMAEGSDWRMPLTPSVLHINPRTTGASSFRRLIPTEADADSQRVTISYTLFPASMVTRTIETPTALRLALASRPNALRELIARVPSAVLIADGSGRYAAVNDLACELTGYSEAELLRMSLPDLTGSIDPRAADVLWQAFIDQGEQRGEFTIRRQDGRTVVVHYHAVTEILSGLHASFLKPVK